MIDASLCIAIWINLICWGTPLQKGASCIFLGMAIAKFIGK